MRAYYVEADFKPKDGYVLSEREKSTGRALRGNQIWKDIRGSVVDRPEPKLRTDEDVLIKVGAAGICGTDMHLIKQDDMGYSMYDGHSKYPIITGHEFAGEVVEVGKNCKKIKVGDLVSVESMHWCGKCEACTRGMFNQCLNLEEPGLTYDGGFAEYAVIDEKYCYNLNAVGEYYGDKMSAMELGAIVEPTGVAYNGLFVRGEGVRPGGNVCVFGCGPIGLAAIQLMKTSGAGMLIAVESVPERVELAKACGADIVLDPTKYESGDKEAEHIMELTHGRGIDLFAECAGATKFTYPVMAKSLAIGGKTVQIGHTVGITPVDIFQWQWNAAKISGSNGQSGCGIYPDVISLMANGRIDMRKIVTGRFNIEDIDEGLKILSGKVLISQHYPKL